MANAMKKREGLAMAPVEDGFLLKPNQVFSEAQNKRKSAHKMMKQVLESENKRRATKERAQKKARIEFGASEPAKPMEQEQPSRQGQPDGQEQPERWKLPMEPVPPAKVDMGDVDPVAPILEQCFFGCEVPQPIWELPDDSGVLASCSRGFPDLGLPATPPHSARDLLLHGLLASCYLRAGACPASATRMLFDQAAASPDKRVAGAAASALLQLQGMTGLQVEAVLGCIRDAPCDSLIYAAPRACALQWQPGARDILAAMVCVGYRAPPQMPAASGGDAARGSMPALARLENLRLLLRLLVAACRSKGWRQQGATRAGLEGDALRELLLATVHLGLDPCAMALAPDLEAAAAAVLEAMEGGQWARECGPLAAAVAAAGPSHRAHLEAVRRLPPRSPRAAVLRSHAAAALLAAVLEPRGSPPAVPADHEPQAVDPAAALAGAKWLAGPPERAAAALIRDGKSRPGDGLLEIQTALEAAEIVLGTGGAGAGSGEAVPGRHWARWARFLDVLEKALRSAPQSDLSTGLNLQITFMRHRTLGAV